nr:unnamed protein product [Callosobruchus analis]
MGSVFKCDNKNDINVLYLNSEGLSKNFDEISYLVTQIKPFVVCLSETHITNDILDNEICIQNYSLVRCNSSSRHTGGVIIYVNNNCTFNILENVSDSLNYWYLFVRIKSHSVLFNVGCVYHSPNASHSQFCDFFESFLENIDLTQVHVILGDFNIRWDIPSDTYRKRINDVFCLQGFKQFVDFSTRVTCNSATTIDLVFSNNYDVNVVPTVHKITDHETISVDLNLIHTFQNKVISYRNIDYEKISYALIGSDWRYDSVDTNEVFNNFLNRMTSALNETCPLIYQNVKFNHKAWFNDTTKTAIYNKKLAYHRFKMDKTANNWRIYQRERNICLSVLRKAKSKYYEEKIDNARSSSTSMWKTLKSIVSTKSSAVIETVLVNNTEYTENLENIFNNFFIESIDVIVQASKANNKMFVFNEELMFTKVCSNHSSITLAQFSRVTLLELRKLIFQQKNKNSVDEINFEMLKATFQVIGYPLLHILNTSLDTGIFPYVMKTSVVRPIVKVAGTKKLDEFRPINMLPNTEKVLELIVHRQVTEHIDKNKLININQSGFREGFSCETALQRVLNDFKISLDNGHILVAVFIDLRRAFETVNRTILLSKLADYFGFDGKVLNWFSSYLSDRRQTTKINQQLSNSVNVEIGVPQGSVLGPLLFILYINDIFSVNIHQCRLHLFADDIVLYSSDSNFSQLVERINTALENLNKWFDENQLTVNTKKSKFMVITNRLSIETVISVKMKNEQLERVSEIKYLGILIDEHLKFSKHADYVSKKISKKLCFAYRVSKHLSRFSKHIIYNTIIKPHFDYCSTIFYMCNNSDIRKLQILQNRCMRFLLNCNIYTSIYVMQSILGWQSIESYIRTRTLIFIFKILNNLVPEYLSVNLQYRFDIHSYNTRQRNHVNVKPSNLMVSKKSIFDYGMSEYNKLPDYVKQSHSVNVFKNRLKMVCELRSPS